MIPGVGMMKKMTLFVALSVAIISLICAPTLAQTTGSTSDNTLYNSLFYQSMMQDENVSEPQPVTLYMYGSSDSGDLKPDFPTNGTGNSAPPARYGGVNTPRHWAWKIGEWYTIPFTAPMTVEVLISGSVWAIGNGQDVVLYVNIYYNGNEIKQIDTNAGNVNGDTEIPFDGSLDETLTIAPGDTLGLWIYGGSRAGSTYELAWGSTQYDSHITFTCNPITVAVNEPIISENNVVFSATIRDAFASTALNSQIRVIGEVDVEALSDPKFNPGENGSTVSWNWDYKTDEGHCGEYTIIIILSYGEENEFTAMGMYMLEFPKAKEEEGFLGGYGWILHPILVVVGVVVAVIVIKKVRSRRKAEVDSKAKGKAKTPA